MSRNVPPRREPKPCPRCYAPMRLVNGRYECERHGAPATAEPDRATNVPARSVARRKSAPRARPPKPPRVSVMRSDDAARADIIAAFSRFRDQHGRLPSQTDIARDKSLPRTNRVRVAFGTWDAAIIACGGEPRPGARRTEPEHGTASRFTNWGCRCDACRAAKQAQRKQEYAAAKERC